MILTKSADQCDSLLTDQTSSLLMSLPLELVAMIGRALDPVSAVCFTLSCKRAACAVGIKCWSLFGRISGRREEKWKLLSTLKRDLPDYHLCFYVGKLCKISSRTSTNSCQRHRRYDDGESDARDDGGEAGKPRKATPGILTFCDMQLLMEKHMFGSAYDFTTSDFAFSMPWVNRGQSRDAEPRFDKRISKLEIVKNELRLYTIQHCLVSYKLKDDDIPTDLSTYDPGNWYSFGTPLCGHCSSGQPARDFYNELTRAVKASMFETKRKCWLSTSYKCSMCPKYFRFAAFHHVDHASVEMAVQSVQIFAPKEGASIPDWDDHAWNWMQYQPSQLFSFTPVWPSSNRPRPFMQTSVPDLYTVVPQQEEQEYFENNDLVPAIDEDVVKMLEEKRRTMRAEKLTNVAEHGAVRSGLSWAKWYLFTAPINAKRLRKESRVW
jgi:hypothetical protein